MTAKPFHQFAEGPISPPGRGRRIGRQKVIGVLVGFPGGQASDGDPPDVTKPVFGGPAGDKHGAKTVGQPSHEGYEFLAAILIQQSGGSARSGMERTVSKLSQISNIRRLASASST